MGSVGDLADRQDVMSVVVCRARAGRVGDGDGDGDRRLILYEFSCNTVLVQYAAVGHATSTGHEHMHGM